MSRCIRQINYITRLKTESKIWGNTNLLSEEKLTIELTRELIKQGKFLYYNYKRNTSEYNCTPDSATLKMSFYDDEYIFWTFQCCAFYDQNKLCYKVDEINDDFVKFAGKLD